MASFVEQTYHTFLAFSFGIFHHRSISLFKVEVESYKKTMSPTTLANSPKTTIDTEYEYYKTILENGHWLELEKGPITSQYIKERSPTPVPVYSYGRWP